ncbi:MAG: hypothetical protein HY814_13055, partial [Candidatus Riflebacteria bacterium]|nr:hypothetical protein [Candidatus Riflebacteria bacterium]
VPLYVALALVVLWVASPLVCRTEHPPARPAEGPPSFEGLNVSVRAQNISVVACVNGGRASVNVGCVNLGSCDGCGSPAGVQGQRGRCLWDLLLLGLVLVFLVLLLAMAARAVTFFLMERCLHSLEVEPCCRGDGKPHPKGKCCCHEEDDAEEPEAPKAKKAAQGDPPDGQRPGQ